MAIATNLPDLEKAKFKESTATANQAGIVVVNPNGTDIGSSTSITTGSTSTRTTVTPSLASQTLVAANTARKGLRVVFTRGADASQNIWISTGTASSTSYYIKQQGSGELSLFSSVEMPYTGAWTVISDVADGTIQIYELS